MRSFVMAAKRQYSSFVPYRKRGEAYEFYLQLRDTDAALNPGLFGLFGGTIEEGETTETGMMREVEEELMYVPVQAQFFFSYEILRSVLHVYTEEVDSTFEQKVKVMEGQYGKFFTRKELRELSNVSEFSALVVAQIDDYLHGA